jgi:hypothetical protein
MGRPRDVVRASVAAVEAGASGCVETRGGAAAAVVAGRPAARAGAGGEELMVAGGSEVSDTKLIGFLILPGVSLNLYG